MSTADPDPLLAAILAAPDDDAPRLIYADWLDERGQPERAAFIRLQVERARLPKFDPRREVLARRAERLFDRHGANWVRELPRIDGITWGEFDRGFPRGVIARTLADFELAAGHLAAVAPIDTLEIRGDSPRRLSRTRPHPALRVLRATQSALTDRPEEFFDAPLLSTLHTLEVRGLGPEVADDGVTALARSRRVENLRELVLDESAIGYDGLVALAGARGLRRLTRLSIRGDGSRFGADLEIRSDAVEALADSHVFARLEALDLSGHEIDDDAIAFLVQSPHLVNLRELNLAGNELTAGGLEVLEEQGWEVRLECLDLSRNQIGDRGARRLAESEVLNELVRLTLDRCEIGPDGADALAGADWFPAIRALSLNDNAIGPGVRAIAAAGAELGELRLRNNDLGSAGARAVAGSAPLGGLLILDVSANGLGSEGVRLLGSSPHLTQLAVLDVAFNGMPKEAGLVEPAMTALARFAATLVSLRLDGNPLNTPGVLGLVTEVEWAQLAELGLRHCGINAPALAYLARDGQFPNLTRLALAGNGVDPKGLGQLLAGPFVAGLTHLDLAFNHLLNDGVRLIAKADLPWLRWLSLENNHVRGTGFNALIRSQKQPRLVTLRSAGNPLGEWTRQLPDRFPGGEEWPVPPAYYGDEEIPF